jgi:hypothetical protein
VAVGLAVTLTALSLSHLARRRDRHRLLDMGVVGNGNRHRSRLQVAIGDKVRRQVARFARPAILGTLTGSAAIFIVARAAYVQQKLSAAVCR